MAGPANINLIPISRYETEAPRLSYSPSVAELYLFEITHSLGTVSLTVLPVPAGIFTATFVPGILVKSLADGKAYQPQL